MSTKVKSFKDLHLLRQQVAENRQRTFAEKLVLLNEAISDLIDDGHPYQVVLYGEEEKKKLPDWYLAKAFGGNAKIPPAEFLYRLCPLKSLIYSTQWDLKGRPLGSEGADEEEWNKIDQKYAIEKASAEEVGKKTDDVWLPLSDFAKGEYSLSPRVFSWWTTYPLYEDVIRGAHHIGMVNNWVAEESVILRCSVDYVSQNDLAFVPSVVDAYTHPIFHATKETANAPYGVTINLSLYRPHNILVPGTDEILLASIPVESISLIPVYVDDSKRPKATSVSFLSDREGLIESLHSYYADLCARMDI